MWQYAVNYFMVVVPIFIILYVIIYFLDKRMILKFYCNLSKVFVTLFTLHIAYITKDTVAILIGSFLVIEAIDSLREVFEFCMGRKHS